MSRERKFTLGPWRVDNKRTQYHVKGNPSPLIMVHKNQINAEANANLIAAAPELLEALESIMSDKGYLDSGSLEDIHAADEAIKKAYGETK